MTTSKQEDLVLLALYVATAGVEGASAKQETIAAFAEAFTFAELECMARKLRAARERVEAGAAARGGVS